MKLNLRKIASDLDGIGDLVEAFTRPQAPQTSTMNGWREVGPNVHARDAHAHPQQERAVNPFRQLAEQVRSVDEGAKLAQTTLRKRIVEVKRARRTHRNRR